MGDKRPYIPLRSLGDKAAAAKVTLSPAAFFLAVLCAQDDVRPKAAGIRCQRFERVGARMARLELVAAIKEPKAPRARVSARTVPVPIPPRDEDRKDHFITRNGLTFAGSHLIIDLWEAEGLDDRDRIEQALIDAVNAAGATLLHIHLHTFSDGGGISGVAVLAESHISVHTWPEKGYAAFDVFMCGDAEPRKALSVFKAAFNPGRIVIGEHKRGVL